MGESSSKRYASADEAVIGFLKAYQEKSQNELKEYGAVVYRKRGEYFLGKTHIGVEGSVIGIFLEALNPFKPGRTIGTIHTHPQEIPRAFGTDSKANSFSGMDAVLPGIRYLGAPNGAIYKSVKNRKPNTVIFEGLAKAPNNTMDVKVFGNTKFWAELFFRVKLSFRRLRRSRKTEKQKKK